MMKKHNGFAKKILAQIRAIVIVYKKSLKEMMPCGLIVGRDGRFPWKEIKRADSCPNHCLFNPQYHVAMW